MSSVQFWLPPFHNQHLCVYCACIFSHQLPQKPEFRQTYAIYLPPLTPIHVPDIQERLCYSNPLDYTDTYWILRKERERERLIWGEGVRECSLSSHVRKSPAEQKLPHDIAAQVRQITCETKLFSFIFSSFQFSSNHWLIETVMNSTFFVLGVIRFLFLKSPRWRAKVCNFFWFHFNLAPILSGSLSMTACFFRIFFLSNTDPVAWNHSNNKQPSIYNHTGACSEKVLFNSFSNNI